MGDIALFIAQREKVFMSFHQEGIIASVQVWYWWDIVYRGKQPHPLSVANLDLKMMKSSLLLLLLINIALASTLDNAPGKETNRVRRRGQSSTDASAKRTQFKEECGDDAACVRQKMREWRKAKQATESFDRIRRRGTSSTDASSKRTQFVEECGEDAACVRQKMREWRKARKAGGETRKF